MSIPLAKISVATSTSICPLLNLNIISSRCAWSKSECIWPQFIFFWLSDKAICFTFCFEPEKIMTRWRLPDLKMSFTISIFWASWQTYAIWRIFSAGLLTASLMTEGLLSKVCASSSIFCGIVAENIIVWQVLGSFFWMVRISSANPISNILSASSSMKKLSLERSTFPKDMCEMKRPGVAIITSAPNDKLLISWS